MTDQALQTAAAPQPAEAPTAVPVRVLYGRKAEVPHGAKPTSGWSLKGFAWLLSIMFCGGVWMMLSRYLPLPRVVDLLMIVGTIALVWVVVQAVINRRRVKVEIGDVPKMLDESAGRLRVVGKPRQLVRLKSLGEVRDEPFEPIVLLTPKVIEMPWQATVVMVVSGLAFCGLMVLLRRTTLPHMNIGWLPFMAGCGLGVGLQMLLWPTYARVTPGRLDIMRYRLGSRRPTTTTVYLRDASVLAQLDKSTLFVKTNAPGSRWTVLNLRGVWSPIELVHAVMRGAGSTAPTPPLPDDELIG